MLFEPRNMFAKDRAHFLMLSSVSLSGFSQEQIRYRKLGKLQKKRKKKEKKKLQPNWISQGVRVGLSLRGKHHLQTKIMLKEIYW